MCNPLGLIIWHNEAYLLALEHIISSLFTRISGTSKNMFAPQLRKEAYDKCYTWESNKQPWKLAQY
jgi:hypothetical protein